MQFTCKRPPESDLILIQLRPCIQIAPEKRNSYLIITNKHPEQFRDWVTAYLIWTAEAGLISTHSKKVPDVFIYLFCLLHCFLFWKQLNKMIRLIFANRNQWNLTVVLSALLLLICLTESAEVLLNKIINIEKNKKTFYSSSRMCFIHTMIFSSISYLFYHVCLELPLLFTSPTRDRSKLCSWLVDTMQILSQSSDFWIALPEFLL